MSSTGNTRQFVRQFIPPVLISALKKILRNEGGKENTFSGNYQSWQDAVKDASGYNEESILNKIKEAALKVKKGEAVFERDSVLFNKPEYDHPLIAALLKIAIESNNQLSVLDFGGSLGTVYLQNKGFFPPLNKLEWSIVEQKHFIEEGRNSFEDEHLRFYFTIDECLAARKPNVVLLSSVLQYLEDADAVINNILASSVNTIIVNRTICIDHPEDVIMVQHVSPLIYKASYPVRLFNYDKLVARFSKNFILLDEFTCYNNYSFPIKDFTASYKGFVLKRRQLEV